MLPARAISKTASGFPPKVNAERKTFVSKTTRRPFNLEFHELHGPTLRYPARKTADTSSPSPGRGGGAFPSALRRDGLHTPRPYREIARFWFFFPAGPTFRSPHRSGAAGRRSASWLS